MESGHVSVFLFTSAVGWNEREEEIDPSGHCHNNPELSLQCPVPLCRRIVALEAEMHFQLTPGSNLKAECSLFPPHTAPSL